MRWLSGLLLLATTSIHAEHYVIGVEDLRYLPYYDYHDGQYAGMARDLLDAFAVSAGHQFEYRALPIKRLYIEFFSGNVDAKFPDNAAWLAQEKTGLPIHYSAPLLAFTDGLLVLPDRRERSKADLRAIATVRGFTAFDFLTEIRSGQIQLHEMDTLDALIRTTLSRRVDGCYFNVVVAERYLAQVLKQPGALVFDPSLPHTRSYYHLSSHKHPQLLSELDAFLQQNPELLPRLYRKWAATMPD